MKLAIYELLPALLGQKSPRTPVAGKYGYTNAKRTALDWVGGFGGFGASLASSLGYTRRARCERPHWLTLPRTSAVDELS